MEHPSRYASIMPSERFTGCLPSSRSRQTFSTLMAFVSYSQTGSMDKIVRESIHVVINTHNRLPLIRETIPRILAATASDDRLNVTHSVSYDDSDGSTRHYLLSLLSPL